MKIGIDIRPLEAPQYGGVAEYINNLLPRLFEIGPQHQFLLFTNSFKKPTRDYSEFLKYKNVKLVNFRYPNKILFFTSKFFNRPYIDKLLGGVDVLFCPHFFPASVSKKCKKITTFHDLSFVNFSEFFDPRRRAWHRYLSPKKQAKASDHIFAVSQSTKQDLVGLYKLSSKKITVIYLGINKDLLNAQDINFKKLNLPKKYILSLSVIGPRKNVISLIRAFDVLKKRREFDNLYLVIAGGYEKFYKRIILKEINKSKYRNKIILLDAVEEKHKPMLYKNAQLFVFPSLYEGFGLPPLEAMYCGVPTLVAHNTSLPEITKGAALLIDPYRPRLLAKAIEEVLTDERLYNTLLIAGRKQAEKFDWSYTARETLDVLIGA